MCSSDLRDNNIYLCGGDNPDVNMVVFKWTGSSWDSGTLWKSVTGNDYLYDGSNLYGSLEHQIPCSGFANAYTNGIDSPYSERPYYFSNASWYSAGTPLTMLSRSSFNDINLDTGDSVTITTKVTIN